MTLRILSASIFALAVSLAIPAQAFNCPAMFGDAQAAIDRATAAMETVEDKTKHGLIHTLIDDAKALLAAAQHNHDKPAAGKYDHARSMAKAGAAKSYAEAAETLANN